MQHLDPIQVIVLSAILFGLFIFLRHFLFYGFAPFLPSHPEVMEQILRELDIRSDFAVYSLGYGRSGFLRLIEEKFPRVKLVGVEKSRWRSLISRLQVFCRRSRIKIVTADYYKADIREANIVYCYLDIGVLREIYKKLKVETRSGAIIISKGFIIPYLDLLKAIPVKERKRWFSFLTGGHEKVLTIKERESRRDNNVYFYEV